MIFFAVQKLLSLIRSCLFIFVFISFTLGDRSKKKKNCCDLCQIAAVSRSLQLCLAVETCFNHSGLKLPHRWPLYTVIHQEYTDSSQENSLRCIGPFFTEVQCSMPQEVSFPEVVLFSQQLFSSDQPVMANTLRLLLGVGRFISWLSPENI